MSAPILLDLFCCQGGAGTGYTRAGFRVIGVDIEPQPRYPFEFVQADAMQVLEYLAERAEPWEGAPYPAAIHASPPCHDHVRTFVAKNGTGWMLAATRERLTSIGVPWVIENVPGAPMRADYKLCGCMFGLPLLARERWFETSWNGFEMRPPCHHPEHPVTVTGNGIPSQSWWYGRVDGYEYYRLCKEAMGIDWMTKAGLSQAIPPAYAEHIGRELIGHLAVAQ
jgi:DNA (cytosine-5)-methyltransferase 1